jgi:hypothetical protein
MEGLTNNVPRDLEELLFNYSDFSTTLFILQGIMNVMVFISLFFAIHLKLSSNIIFILFNIITINVLMAYAIYAHIQHTKKLGNKFREYCIKNAEWKKRVVM